MMHKGLFSQIAMIALSVGIVFFYIEPTFTEISDTQDQITMYQTEREKVSDVNRTLASLVERLKQVPSQDQIKLLTYIPDAVDPVAVSRILQFIADDAGVLFRKVDYQGVKQAYVDDAEEEGLSDYPTPHEFSVDIQGTYDQVKEAIAMIEKNEFPLEIHELEVEVLEGGFLNVSMIIVTYSHKLPEESYFSNN